MKVLIADKFEKSGIEGLKAAGCEVVFEPDLKDDTLVEAIKKTQAEVLVVRSTAVSEAMLDSGNLALATLLAAVGLYGESIDTTSPQLTVDPSSPVQPGSLISNLNTITLAVTDPVQPGLDPSDPTRVWTYQEYATSAEVDRWTTCWVAFALR